MENVSQHTMLRQQGALPENKHKTQTIEGKFYQSWSALSLGNCHLSKRKTHTHLIAAYKASHYYGHSDSRCRERTLHSQSSKALFYLHLITSRDRPSQLWRVEGPSECEQPSLPVSGEGIFLSHIPSPLCLTGQVAWTIGQSYWEQNCHWTERCH